MLAIPMKGKDFRSVPQATVEISFEIIDKREYKPLPGTAIGFVEKLTKERGFPCARACNN
jgi:hypothetical protein